MLFEMSGEVLGFLEHFGARDFSRGMRRDVTCGSGAKTEQFEMVAGREPDCGALGGRLPPAPRRDPLRLLPDGNNSSFFYSFNFLTIRGQSALFKRMDICWPIRRR